MKELLNLINFDCKNERFAEVFGDCIETEDIQAILKGTKGIIKASDLIAVNSADRVGEAFDFIDSVTMEYLAKAEPKKVFGVKNYLLVRAFFRFINDCYNWEDYEADTLERFETELFDSLGTAQKNYRALTFESTEQSRFNLFLKFNHYLSELLGDAIAFKCMQTVEDDLSPREKAGLYLGLI